MHKVTKLSASVLLLALLLSACSSSVQPAPAQIPTNTNQTTPLPPSKPSPPQASALPTGVSIGNIAPDFQLQTLAGDNISLSSLRGKPVLLNFWATWCPPCKFEMPFLQQIHDSYSDKGLVVLEVDVGEKSATVEKFMTDLNLSMTVALDTNMKVTNAYLVGAIPTTFLIDKDGVIQQKVVGAFPNVAAIENELKKIMP